MTDPQDKWVWGDEPEVTSPGASSLERTVAPSIEWFEPAREPATDADSAARPPAAASAPPNGAVSEPPSAANGRHVPSSVVKATVLHLDGQVEAAIEELRSGLEEGEPRLEIYAAMGALQMELERFEDAAASYREVLKRNSGNETASVNLAACEARLKELKKPPKPPQCLVKAIVLHMEGKIEEAVKELQRGVKAGDKTADVYAALGHLQFETGRFDSAAESYAQVVEREPLHRTCHYNLAVCLEKMGRHKDALASFEKAYEINSTRVEFGIGMGVALLHLRRYPEAAGVFERCLISHPGDGAALFGKAFALQCQGKAAEAEAAYTEALKQEPSHEEALANLIALTAGSASAETAARQYCARLLELRPESKLALEALLSAELAKGDYEAACAVGERLTRAAADSFEAWFNFGVACQGATRFEHAVAAFSKAARIRPKSFEAQSSLGAALQQRGDLAGAKSAFEAALKISPEDPAALWGLARLAEQSGNGREAERLYATFAAKAPKPEAALFRLGALRFERGDFPGSVEAYRACLKGRKDSPAAQLNLGLALWKAEEFEEARQQLESVNGSFAGEALRALALMSAEREDYPRALTCLKKLIEAGERTPEVYYNLGLVLQNLGRPEEAAQHYRDALAAQPDMAEAIQALAQVTKGPARVEEIRKSVRKEPALAPRLLKSR